MQTILVVDDDESVRDLIDVILTLEGYRVLLAGTGEEALDITRTNVVDLVTIDLGLPGMDGLELSRRLREEPQSQDCRQMIVSGGRIDPLFTVDAVLTKPFDFTAFIEVVRRLFREPLRGSSGGHPTGELERILQLRLIGPVFQPIVDLETREILGVEGLARGPIGSDLHLPGPLFAAAHEAGRLYDLDSLCRFSVLTAAQEAGSLTPQLVFINVEPGTTELPMSQELRSFINVDISFQVVVEFTERALTRRLPALMRHAEEIRSRGSVIALDDMGLDPRAVAMLPLLQPEIVKLDMSLLHSELTETAANTAVAVSAYAERTGANVIAEGIETEEHLALALALGATWGQGWLFGRPGPMSDLATRSIARRRQRLVAHSSRPSVEATTPYELAAQNRKPRQGTVDLLHGIALQMKTKARTLGDLAVVLLLIPEESPGCGVSLADPLLDGYDDLAQRAAVFGLIGRGVADEPMPGVYGVDLDADDPLCNEWLVLVLGPHDASMLCGRNVTGPDGPTDRVDFVVTHDRELADEIARRLTRRFIPRSAVARTTALLGHPVTFE